MSNEVLSKILIVSGIFLLFTGILIRFLKYLPFGHIPGDIFIQKNNFTFYFPLTTSIIISIFLSLLFIFLFKK